ncbi:MAG: putative ABC transporter permease [Oscillospiraceae bacterium]
MTKQTTKQMGDVGEGKAHFASGLNFYNLFWVFFIGSFLGVVVETIWIFFKNGYIESRVGLIYGLFNLVYGFGALAMMIGLYPLRKKSDRWLMLGGVLIGTFVEYFSSWVEEMLFGSASWNYSNLPLNLNGRVNLLYSFFWGFLAIFWVKDIYPRISGWIKKIPNNIGKPLTWVLAAFMLFNIAMSLGAVKSWSRRVYGQPVDTQAEQWFEEKFPDKKMEKIFPSMQFIGQKED